MKTKIFVKSNLPPETKDEELTDWLLDSGKPIELYRFLRANPTQVKYRDISQSLKQSPNTVVSGIKFLEENHFLITKQDQNDRYLCLQDIPRYRKVGLQRTRAAGRFSFLMGKPLNKTAFTEAIRESHPEVRNVRECYEIYSNLVRLEGELFFVKELLPDAHRQTVHMCLRYMQESSLLLFLDKYIFVFGEDRELYNEISLTLADPEYVELPKELLKKIEDSPYNRLINLYRALRTDRGLSAAVTPADRVAAINLLKGLKYDQIKPLLVIMILDPATFPEALRNKFEKYGATLSTMHRNLNAMQYSLVEYKAMYTSERYWTKHLRGDLRRFENE